MAKKLQQELNADVLELLLKKLSFPDVVRFSAVCSAWQEAAKSSKLLSRPILITIPGNQTDIDRDDVMTNANALSLQLFSLAENKVIYDFNNALVSSDLQEQCGNCRCIGSSKAMLVFLGDQRSSNPNVLINPFSQESFRLPSIGLESMGGIEISKAVVLVLPHERGHYCDPSKKKKRKIETNLVLVVINGLIRQRITYCDVGPGRSWTVLDGEYLSYQDILCREGRLYALSELGSVEVWDFMSGSRPTKVMKFVPSEVLPSVVLAIGNYSEDKFFEQRYLVESMGEFLLVRRFVGYYVNTNGELLNEDDLLTDENTHPLVCPYRTIEFDCF